MPDSAVSVRQLNLYVKSLLEGDRRLADISVTGELSNFKRHYASGHLYFTLKDEAAAVPCVMFRGSAVRLKFEPCDGALVTVRGRVSLYEKDGKYQLYADEMQQAGTGALLLAFEKTKRKLMAEGLFDEASKRALPKFPRRIAVITSETGAAVRDILNILSRRWPIAQIVMCPASVQGELAVPELTAALDRVYALQGIDIIIIGRGGGSTEDLWAFNSEELARKIYESPVPVISAVGHETDFSISDFVADLRAPTPSAAAELAVPDVYGMMRHLETLKAQTVRAVRSKYELCEARYRLLSGSRYLRKPLDIISSRAQRLDLLTERCAAAMTEEVKSRETSLAKAAAALDALSPLKTVSRGFAAVSRSGCAVKSAVELEPGDNITLTMVNGCADCRVTDVRKEENSYVQT